MSVYRYTAKVNAFSWTPSTYRMLAIPSVDAAQGYPATYEFTWPLNYFNSQLDFSINITQLLWSTSDSIVSVTASSFPTDLDIIYVYGKGGIATVWFAGGSANTVYNVSVNITTAQQRIIPLNISLSIPGPGFITSTIQYAVVQVPKSYVDNADDELRALALQALTTAQAAFTLNNPATIITLTDYNGLSLTDYNNTSLVVD